MLIVKSADIFHIQYQRIYAGKIVGIIKILSNY